MANTLCVVCGLLCVILLHDGSGTPITFIPLIKSSLTGLENSAFLNKSLYAINANLHKNSYGYDKAEKISGSQIVTVKKPVHFDPSGTIVNSATVTPSRVTSPWRRSLNSNKEDHAYLINDKMQKQGSLSKEISNSIATNEILNKSLKSSTPDDELRAARRVANTVLPNADQLDMAPARGAYVNDMRVNNKFCYRHILWPEGPKYDSKGNTMMPLFLPRQFNGKDFFQTVKPLYVLPRCCNCCKKSVLGCQ